VSSEVAEVSKFELARRGKIDTLEKVLMGLLVKHPEAEATTTVQHHYAPGVYVREFFSPKDTVVTSRVHQEANLFILVKGHARVVSTTQEKEQIDVYKDFAIFVTPPRTKRALHFLEDTIILTVHPNPEDSKDVEELVSRITTETFEEKTT